MEVKQKFIASGRANRPGGKNTIEYITIHETGNYAKGADASAHASYLQTTGDKVSWHFSVDEKGAYQHLPVEECAYHAGTRDGNNRSIGIEICVNSDGNFNKAVGNTAELVKRLMREHGIPVNRVVQHNFWSGKNCPQNLRLGGWDEFVASLKTEEASSWAKPSWDKAKALGITDGTNPQGTCTREQVIVMLERCGVLGVKVK